MSLPVGAMGLPVICDNNFPNPAYLFYFDYTKLLSFYLGMNNIHSNKSPNAIIARKYSENDYSSSNKITRNLE